jgi:hypothetical protein
MLMLLSSAAAARDTAAAASPTMARMVWKDARLRDIALLLE